ncbi:MAG TPA: hypothetical protein VN517_07715 [Terriglobales bacterium]|jgi:hypothetical protein|nr:hypothetical protein [Terriglobales bacterium]
MSTAAPVLVPARVDQAQQRWHMEGIWFQLAVCATAFLIIFFRRPDALLNPQFFAEDGAFFYRDAYQLGLHSLLLTYGGYLHILLRLTAFLALLFPFAWAPLVMNVVGSTLQVLPVNIFLSSRFSNIGLPVRLLAGFAYLALPNCFEIHVTATNLQSHQALLTCLVLLAQPAKNKFWKSFDAITIVLTSLSSPAGVFLLPVGTVMWWYRQEVWSAIGCGFLLPGTAIQSISVLLHWHARQVPHYGLTGWPVFNGGPLGANFHYFAGIFGRQIFLSSLLGLTSQNWLLQLHSIFAIEVLACAVGFGLLLYALGTAPIELKLFILFAYAVLALELLNPLAGTPDHPQWYWLNIPGCGNRYYFVPMLAFLASVSFVAIRKKSPKVLRWFAVLLLALLPIGIYRDFRYPPFIDFEFKVFAQKLQRVAPGTKVLIPINPGWLMQLTKH